MTKPHSQLIIRQMQPEDFDAVLALGEAVHGDGYLDLAHLQSLWQAGIKAGINASFVALDQNGLLGFRLTLAAGQWHPDRWCSPSLWGIAPDRVCYFKSNTLAPVARGRGLGGILLQHAVDAVKAQGALGGIAHLWQESPHNAAVRYFSKAGGKLIKAHPDRWNQSHDNPDYLCTLCGNDCHCTACEMLLVFQES
ncbi:GNAT family N-acetyltransferase [Shewanella sp. FJAT-52076]|uniref:GNAT family N-acetyltransferase n=1 Tax=Shewanella sp. FJAT-52076 TaxID=2864202 RepID=UPI001C654FDD|nr:GNAT family N-acetyltransferase [Shewanella sp. FJAT-52076]QYJ74258.1 GNAT family N-acetyltransferase [Shewanella sp. FJAT-52076]